MRQRLAASLVSAVLLAAAGSAQGCKSTDTTVAPSATAARTGAPTPSVRVGQACKRAETPEQAAKAFIGAYASADPAGAECFVEPALARIDARGEGCSKEKQASLNCELDHVDVQLGKGGVLGTAPEPKPTCDAKALKEAATACLCRTPANAAPFVASATHRRLSRLGLSEKDCRVQDVSDPSRAAVEEALPEWGEACDDFDAEAKFALAIVECNTKPQRLELLLRKSTDGWKVFTLTRKTRALLAP